jgi:threonine aldolase
LRKTIDLRSDTVTLPTEEMLEAIRAADLGDEGYKEDPTVNRLEEMAAKMLGKESALLVTSGTQANLVSVMSHTGRGESVILEAESHIYWNEVGGVSAIAGLFPIPVKGKRGVLDVKAVATAIRIENVHYPKTTLLCLENTHNRAGGTITTPDQIEKLSATAKNYGLRIHLDGARIFNAAVATKIDVAKFTKNVDSLMFCLSKGLSCPIGSLVVGDYDFIKRARKIRQSLGGNMRQAGIIAAPGIVALEKMIDRLEEDHTHARILAEKLAKIDKTSIDLQTVQTNIVHFDVSYLGITSEEFVSKLQKYGVLALTRDKTKVRLVAHRGIEREHIEKTVNIVTAVVQDLRKDT